MSNNPLRLNAFVNGEATLASQPVVVTTRGLTFDILLDRLTARLKPTFGAVRRLYTIEGVRVAKIEDISDDGRYVVAGAEPFKNVKYSDQSASLSKKEKTVVPPPANGEVKLPKIVSEGKATKIAAKPKIVFILRNGDLAGQPSRILLPLNVTLEHALFLITDRVKLDSGAVRRLYTMQGVEVLSVDDLQDQERYIAVGREQLRPIDPAIAASRLPPISKQGTHVAGSPARQATQVPAGHGSRVQTTKYDGVERELKGLLGDPAKKKDLDALWTRLDFNGNNIVSLAEIDKLVVEKYSVLNNKPALMRAYKQTTLREGDGDAWVERDEFPALLRNLLYFNKLFSIFDDIDTDDDRRLTLEEFKAGCSKMGLRLSEKDAATAFDAMDSNDGGKVLFDEFCVYVAKASIPVGGETKKTYTTTTDQPGAASPSPQPKAAAGSPLKGLAAAAVAAAGQAASEVGRQAGVSPTKAGVQTAKYAQLEKDFKVLMGTPAGKPALDALWTRLDFNGNNIVSLAEIDKLVVEKYPVLDNKPALMRAYKQTTLREGDGDAWVERDEFPALLRNLLYFNKLFSIFDDIDTDDDRRLTLEEFKAGCSKMGLRLSEKDAAAAFDAMDSNDGGKVLFDEFCVYIAKASIAIDGETKKTFTTNEDR